MFSEALVSKYRSINLSAVFEAIPILNQRSVPHTLGLDFSQHGFSILLNMYLNI